MLTIRNLSKSVPGARLLFEHLDLDLSAGEFVAVRGESGVGKSTLLNLIAGLDVADAGSIVLNGKDWSTLNDDARTLRRRDELGFVFQAFHVLSHLTLLQNVALPLVLQKQPSAQIDERAMLALAEVGLAGRAADFPRQLSGGELQRVAIARALVHRPGLILADEPTGNLDPDTAHRVLELFASRVRLAGAAVLLVTHSERAALVADRQVLLTRQGLLDG